MDWLLVAIRFVHIAAAVIAGGAAFFQFFAVRPALAGVEESQRAAFRDALLRRWFPIVQAVIAALLITGLVNFLVYKIPFYKPHPLKGVYHGLLGVKIIAALLVFHTATVLALPGPRGDKWRANPLWRNLQIGALALIVAIGAVLVNFDRVFPRGEATSAAQPVSTAP